MARFKLLLLGILPLLSGINPLVAQVDNERSHWLFGKNARISFDANGIVDVGTSPLNAYSGSACYSNQDGELLLSTNGNVVYDGNGSQMGLIFGLDPETGTTEALILPINTEETKFYIFTISPSGDVRYALADLNTGVVTLNPRILLYNSCNEITAVKHCFLDAYWLITSHKANDYATFLVKPNSISQPVYSTIGGNRSNTGDMVASFQGDKLAVSNYSENWVEVYDFDSRCGTVSNARRLPDFDNTDNPHGMTFAPDGKSLYVAWSYAKSNLLQYPFDNPGSIYNCFSSSENINDIEIAPDGKMYLNVHKDGTPSRRIHRLDNPNAVGGGSRVTMDVASLPIGTNGAFEFPNFIHHKTGGCDGVQPGTGTIQVSDNRCTNNLVNIDALKLSVQVDSLRWNFDDPTKPDNRSNAPQISRYFSENRVYNVECYLYFCSFVDTVRITLDMKEPPVLDLGKDTIICAEATYGIGFEPAYDSIVWSDGSRAPFRLASPGTYSATAYNGRCRTTDQIIIRSYPDIWTQLDAEYSICDLENEAVKLDAGKGFEAYKWMPTGDTTQWIIVQEIGEYVVIVDAFTGCSGSGTTTVKRICDLDVFIPNAFSPNNDGLNEVFRIYGEHLEYQHLQIYSLWGELLFDGEGTNVEWTGDNYPGGTYIYQATIEGFYNKIPTTVQRGGTVQLLK